jgi:diguanylate cyclase (GGDEF)-like protein/PAS domain S-box-containing protein
MVSNEAAARKVADRFRHIFEASPGLQVLKDCQSTYLAVNPAYAQFLGKTEDLLLGKSDSDFFPHSQANSFRQQEENVMALGIPQATEEKMHGIQGDRLMQINRSPVFDENHELVGVLVSSLDISEMKKDKQLLETYQHGLIILSEVETRQLSLHDLSALNDNYVSWAGKIADTPHVCLCQVDREHLRYHIQIGKGKLTQYLGLSFGYGEDVAGKVLQSGQICIANDYHTWSENTASLRKAGFTAAVGLPIEIEPSQTGALCLYYDKPGQVFTQAQVELLRLLTRSASARIQSVAIIKDAQNELEESGRVLEKCQYRLRLERILAAIATHFINIPTEKIDDGIRRGLQSIGKAAEVEQCYVVLFKRGGVFAEDLIAWQSSDVDIERDLLGDLTAEDFQGHLGKLNQLEPIYLLHSSSFASADNEGREFLESRGIKSFAAFPMVVNRVLIGYFAFEAKISEMDWSQEIISLFKIGADMFVYALERKWAARAAREGHDRLLYQIASLEQRNREGVLFTEMGDLLQACRTADEAYPIIARYVQRVVPACSGALYMIQDSEDPAETVAKWGDSPPGPAEHELVPNECWGLRRGRPYLVNDMENEPVCVHVKEPHLSSYFCIPLIGQGATVGMMHLRITQDAAPLDENRQRLAIRIAEYISLALTNLRLRDELRSQAIRDPLTGLFNRRYMEETLDREIRRANRHKTTVGVIMFDVDNMKPINDSYGHDAGDVLLKALGAEMMRLFRGEDVACRYGGDEFTIVLPEASLADVWRRAEQLRETIKKMEIRYDGQKLGPVTLSIGVAAYPDHGLTAEKVLMASDAASYASKQEGGDRTMVGDGLET